MLSGSESMDRSSFLDFFHVVKKMKEVPGREIRSMVRMSCKSEGPTHRRTVSSSLYSKMFVLLLPCNTSIKVKQLVES